MKTGLSVCLNSLLKNVIEAADARQKRATDSPGANQHSARWPRRGEAQEAPSDKRSLHVVCRFATPHFESVFNAAAATQIVFQQAVKEALTWPPCQFTAKNSRETLIYAEFVWRKDAPPFSLAASH
jgi:hypothetical protein